MAAAREDKVIKIEPEDLHSLSKLMSLEPEEFVSFFKDKNLGYVLSIKNLTRQMFNDAKKTKDELVDAFPTMKAEKKEKTKAVLDQLYNVLANLEEKHLILLELENSRKLKPN